MDLEVIKQSPSQPTNTGSQDAKISNKKRFIYPFSLILVAIIFLLLGILVRSNLDTKDALVIETVSDDGSSISSKSNISPELTNEIAGYSSLDSHFDMVTHSFTEKTSRDITIAIPKLSNGKVAFIKDGNLFVATSDGLAARLTNDADNEFSKYYPFSVSYRLPQWSPDSEKLSVIQRLGSNNYAAILITDLKEISHDSLMVSYNYLPPYWLDNENIMIAKRAINTDKLDGITWTGSGTGPYIREYIIPDGCGGGPGEAWQNLLHKNNYGQSRATFFYIDSIKEGIYTTGCRKNTSFKVTEGREAETDFYARQEDGTTPKELLLSPDKTKIVGVHKGKIILLDLSGNIISTLYESEYSYGPVFSKSGGKVYFVESKDDIPKLYKIDINTNGSPVLLYESSSKGALSNITASPNDEQLIFTLIVQLKDPDHDNEDWTGTAKEDLYIINTDGSNLELFAENSSQSSWSSR